MTVQSTQPRRVGLLLHNIEFHHKIFLGILEYARLYRNWAFERALPQVSSVRRFKEQGIEGVIGQLVDAPVVEAVRESGLSAVNISAAWEVTEVPNVLANDFMIGQLAADDLFSQGMAHFAFVGQDNLLFVEHRRRGFVYGLGELACGHAYSELLNIGLPEPTTVHARHTDLGRWLLALPKPAGVFCSNDIMAFCVHRVARDCGLDLRRDVRLMGVDNQLDYCEAVHPPFSSVEHGMTGFRAAETLERLMDGQAVAPTLLVPPKGIVSRDRDASTPSLPSEVHAVMQLITSRLGEPLQIDDLLRGLPLSRRYIEKRFKQVTGRSIYQEVQRQRIERASMLLRTTHWPIERVGSAAGFTDPRQFSRAFRQFAGFTPRAYRREQAADDGLREGQ